MTFSAFLYFQVSAQVAVTSDGSVPDSSAMLDVKSTTRGFLPPRMTYAERTAIALPAKGLMVYQNNTDITPEGFYIFNGVAWKQIAKVDDIGGGSAWTLAGTSLYSNHGGNVGIGIAAPAYKLDVAGNINSTGNAYIAGALGVNTTSPSYLLQVNDGSIAMYNTTDLKTWYFNYSSSGNYFQLSESGTPRFVVANGGNVGIGTTTPAATLEVNGSSIVDGNITATGNITTNGKGILRNANGSGQLKYYTRTAAFSTANMAAFATSAEGSIGFTSGIFTSPPQVIVGDIVSTGGTVGQLYRVQLVIYDVTTTGCHCRLINTSNGPVNYSITWNIVCIGQ